MIPFPFQAAGAGLVQQTVNSSSDPYFASVVTLLHFEGANGSTTFTCQKGNTYTVSGNAQLTTTSPLVGGASGLFDGAGDYITAGPSGNFEMGTGDFTVEATIQTSVKNKVIIDLRQIGAPGIVFFTRETTGYLGAFANTGSPVGIYGNTDVCDGSVHNVAFSRVSGTLYLFVDGTLQNSGAMANNLNNAAICRVGAANNGTLSWNGRIDEVRVTKGVGRYTSSYTPVAPFPDN